MNWLLLWRRTLLKRGINVAIARLQYVRWALLASLLTTKCFYFAVQTLQLWLSKADVLEQWQRAQDENQ